MLLSSQSLQLPFAQLAHAVAQKNSQQKLLRTKNEKE
jgi:hypothetical protein